MGEIAILMAAGLGSRMRPLTEVTAKPLVCVREVPLIETVIAALDRRGVEKIFVVTGYKGEQFASLAARHAKVQLVPNVDYAVKNNINSIAVVADELGQADAFICEADLFIRNPELLNRPLRQSGYFGKKVLGFSDDWIFETTEGAQGPRITAIHKGGVDCWNMVGISYFRREEARKIAEAVREAVKAPENAQLFWDEIVDRLVRKGELSLTIHPVQAGEIVECDTLEDLRQLEQMR